jgi:hypothetical protein
MNKTIYNLPCYDSRKDFHGKAKVIISENGTKFLQSYNTIVARLDSNGTFTKLWSGYSATTMRHINSFFDHFAIDAPGGKSWWESLEVSA